MNSQHTFSSLHVSFFLFVIITLDLNDLIYYLAIEVNPLMAESISPHASPGLTDLDSLEWLLFDAPPRGRRSPLPWQLRHSSTHPLPPSSDSFTQSPATPITVLGCVHLGVSSPHSVDSDEVSCAATQGPVSSREEDCFVFHLFHLCVCVCVCVCVCISVYSYYLFASASLSLFLVGRNLLENTCSLLTGGSLKIEMIE